MVNYVKGNLLDSNCDYICHQVNCQGVMGSGIAKQIRERWPEVYRSYRAFYEDSIECCINMLGRIDIADTIDGHSVINMFTQQFCGYDGKRYTSYDAFVTALETIRYRIPIGYTIGFPKGIGCGLGGGNWKVISALIEEILGKYYDVFIYELED